MLFYISLAQEIFSSTKYQSTFFEELDLGNVCFFLSLFFVADRWWDSLVIGGTKRWMMNTKNSYKKAFVE